MATSPKKMTATVTPGRNTPVNRVVRIEDLLKTLQQGAKPARARSVDAEPVRQLAAELEARLRELRRAASGSPAPAAKARGKPRR